MEVQDIKQQLKGLIVSSLRLTDITPAELTDEQPLLGGDFEIDSIDVLQLIVEIERTFGIRLVTGRFDPQVWQNVNSLAAAVQSKLSAANEPEALVRGRT